MSLGARRLAPGATTREDGRVTAATSLPDAGRTTDPGEPEVSRTLLDAIRDLRRDVATTRFPLDVEGAEEARASRTRLLDQLDDHLLPRLADLSAPAIVVVAGSTGAGKSTLVNSVLGTEVTQAGVLRPTTRRPVLAHHPDDADLLSTHPVLDAVEVVAHESVPRGIALLDAPDIDSVLETNRDTAHRLLEAADLWLFVTTASRYGDALPWRVLDDATARGASIAMVLNRVPPGALTTVRGDLLGRLRSRGMASVPLFVVADVGPHEGLLDPKAVAPIGRWLTMLAGPDRARSVISRTLRGSLAALRPWVDELAEAVQAQAEAALAIRSELAPVLEAPAASARGRVVAGEVAAGAARSRWAQLTATGAPLWGLVSRRGRISGTKRLARARAEALAALTADLRAAARVSLYSAGELAAEAIATHLEARGAIGRGVLGMWRGDAEDGVNPAERRNAERAVQADEAAARWASAVGPAVADAASRLTDKGATRRWRKASSALGDGGLEAVVLAAGAGLEPAGDLLRALVGTAAQPAVDATRTALLERTDEMVSGELAAVVGVLDTPHLAEDASATLRLRLAVLKAAS